MQILRSSSELTILFDQGDRTLTLPRLQDLATALLRLQEIDAVRLRWESRPRLTVCWSTGTDAVRMLRQLAVHVRELLLPATVPAEGTLAISPRLAPAFAAVDAPAEPGTDGPPAPELPPVPQWRVVLRQSFYGCLAGGAFVMSWVGLIVPGIPTVPFVILTAHFALKASPAFRARLLRSRVFGPMMKDWQERGAVRRSVQIKAYLLTLLILTTTLIFAPLTATLLVLVLVMGALGLFIISRIPVYDPPKGTARVWHLDIAKPGAVAVALALG